MCTMLRNMRAMSILAGVFILLTPSLSAFKPRSTNVKEIKYQIILRTETCSQFDSNHRVGGNLISNYPDINLLSVRF